MAQHLDDLGNVPSTRELQLAQDELAMLNQRYAAIAKEAGWLAASSVPVVGGVVDVASAIGNAWSGNWGSAGLDLVGLIPFYGDGVKAGAKGTKLAAYGAKLANQISKAKAKVRGIEDHVRKSKAAQNFWKSKKGKEYKKLQEELKKCKTKECRKKKIEEYKNNKNKNIPRSGTWDGKPGDSKWKPDPGSDADKALKKYGQDGINYKNGKPDYSPFTKKGPDGRPIEARIDMQGNHKGGTGDYGQARDAMKDRYGSWSTRRDEDGFTWHHNEDTSTMQLVDSKIHGGSSHSGGASAINDPAY